MKPTKISFVRHGLVFNPDQIYYGRLPNFGLSDEGRQQAGSAALTLEEFELDTIYHSPLLRTTQTAEILTNGSGEAFPVKPCDLLLEVHTPYDGRPLTEMAAREWNMYEGNLPPYELPADVLQRVQTFIKQVLSRHPGQHVAAVTHGDIIGFTILWALGREVTVTNKLKFLEYGLPEAYPATASITTLTINGPDLPKHLSLSYVNPYHTPKS